MKKLIKNPSGYLVFKDSKKSYAKWKLEKKLGRKLKYTETAHHINNNKLDNRSRNLRVVSQRKNNTLAGNTLKKIKKYQRRKKTMAYYRKRYKKRRRYY